MTPAEVELKLCDCKAWAKAPEAMKEAFAAEMSKRHYGEPETRNAWLWYRDGWRTCFSHYTGHELKDGDLKQ